MRSIDNISKDRLHFIANNMQSVIIGTTAASMFLVYLVKDFADKNKLFVWLGYMFSYVILRIIYSIAIKKKLKKDNFNTQSYISIYCVLVVYYGIGWGLFSMLFFSPEHINSLVLVTAMLVFIASTSIAVITSFPIYVVYLSLMLGPMMYQFFSHGPEEYKVYAVMIASFSIFLLYSSRMFGKTLTDSLLLRYENEVLLEDMQQAQKETTDTNRKLAIQVTENRKTQEELISEKNKAEEVVRIKSEFLATMSHEIRTPMNGILGMADLLLGTKLGGKQNHFVETIKSSGESLLSIINDILDFSKIESGKFEINNEAFELREVIEECMGLFAEPALRNKLDVYCNYASDMHSVFFGDKVRIQQIVNNLLSNAIKFTKHGEVSIDVSFKSEDAQKATVLIQVRDTGIGIPAEVQQRIFDSFTQADGTTTRKYGGTGLGLAICKKIVNLMNGEIGVTSKKNKGSCFWIQIPFNKAQNSDIKNHNVVDISSLKNKKVLIADENQANQEILIHKMSSWGMKCFETTTAKETLHVLLLANEQHQDFDIVVIDKNISNGKGMQLVQKIKNNRDISKTEVIMMTTVGNLDETGTWMTAGISAYLQKPIRQKDLLEAMNKAASGNNDKTQTVNKEQIENENIEELHLQGKILVAEDNIVNTELITLVLEKFGLRYQTVENGEEAFRAITEHDMDRLRDPYNLILMDCQMPFMDGFEATKRIRAWEEENQQTKLPIVALTANAMQGDKERCLASGMDDYLTKPFTHQELGLLLKDWLPIVKKQTVSKSKEKEHLVNVKKNQTYQSEMAKLDQKILQRIRSLQKPDKADVLLKVIDAYLENTPGIIEKIRHGIQLGNAESIFQAAHALKSSSASLGANDLAEICRQIEIMGKNGNLLSAFEKMDILDFEYETACAALKLEAEKQKLQKAA